MSFRAGRSQLAPRASAIGGLQPHDWTTPWQAWYTVVLLVLLYSMSWIDRNILGLLAQPVSEALGLIDRQMAILLGLSFALFYAVGGLLVGHLVDTRNRRIVVVSGVIVWSVATILSAFATSFETMLLLRCGVALGEAVLMPAAISLIADLFPRERRGLPVAVFTSVGGLMAFGSYAVGAGAIALAVPIGFSAGLDVWRTTLIIVGVPGLALALMFALGATVPARSCGATDGGGATVRALLDHVRGRLSFLGPLLSLTGISCVFNTTFTIWLPTVFIREHGMTASQAGYIIALVAVPAGLFGNFFWQWWGARLQKRNAAKGHVHAFIIPTLITGPCYIAGFLTSNVTLQLIGFAAGLFAGVGFNVLSQIAIQFYAPAQMRARMVSINYLLVSLLGYGLGPSAAVELGQHLTEGSSELRYGLIGLTIVAWPILILATMTAVRNVDGPAEA